MSNTTSRPFFFQRALREPVVHFTLIAAIFFLVTEFVSSGGREVIEIDRQEVAWRIQQIEGDTPLSEEERRLAERSYIDEQILAREARILGFDDDQRIRSILSQKMLHILSGGVIQPTEAEPGVWVGPQQTTLGEHWFRVTDRFDEVIPPAFDAILGQVRFDWIGEKEEALLQERIAELRELYSVKFIGEGPSR